MLLNNINIIYLPKYNTRIILKNSSPEKRHAKMKCSVQVFSSKLKTEKGRVSYMQGCSVFR
jgi:hypothetical protein